MTELMPLMPCTLVHFSGLDAERIWKPRCIIWATSPDVRYRPDIASYCLAFSAYLCVFWAFLLGKIARITILPSKSLVIAILPNLCDIARNRPLYLIHAVIDYYILLARFHEVLELE